MMHRAGGRKKEECSSPLDDVGGVHKKKVQQLSGGEQLGASSANFRPTFTFRTEV